MKGHAGQRIEVKKKFGIKNLAVGSGSHEPEAFRVPMETIALLIIPSEIQKNTKNMQMQIAPRN